MVSVIDSGRILDSFPTSQTFQGALSCGRSITKVQKTMAVNGVAFQTGYSLQADDNRACGIGTSSLMADSRMSMRSVAVNGHTSLKEYSDRTLAQELGASRISDLEPVHKTPEFKSLLRPQSAVIISRAQNE